MSVRNLWTAGGVGVALAPAALLLLGVLAKGTVQPTTSRDLVAPLSEFPARVAGFRLTGDRALSAGELRVLNPDAHLNRTYGSASGSRLTLSIAYYGRQLGGASIHSPRNCLPGSGWEPVEHVRVAVTVPYGKGAINRYVVEHESGARAVVYYWYQGRGRIAANEYAVKWDLLRDAMIRRRTDEALVRLVFPVRRGEELSEEEAMAAVRDVAIAVDAHLPG